MLYHLCHQKKANGLVRPNVCISIEQEAVKQEGNSHLMCFIAHLSSPVSFSLTLKDFVALHKRSLVVSVVPVIQ